MTTYSPVEILIELVKNNFQKGRNNSACPTKDGRLPMIDIDWDENPNHPLPSIEFLNESRRGSVISHDGSARFDRDYVRVKVRGRNENETWKIGMHLWDIFNENCKSFTELSKFPNMEYSFLKTLSNNAVNEYEDGVTYWLFSMLIELYRVKVYELN